MFSYVNVKHNSVIHFSKLLCDSVYSAHMCYIDPYLTSCTAKLTFWLTTLPPDSILAWEELWIFDVTSHNLTQLHLF